MKTVKNSRISKSFDSIRGDKTLLKFANKKLLKFIRSLHLLGDKLVYLGGFAEFVTVRWLLKIYQSKFRLDWEYSKTPPHFYNHRMGMSQFVLGDKVNGPFAYYRGFYAAQIIKENDRLLDIGCGDGFFTKRFFSAKCLQVDGIDIEPSAIQYAVKENAAENVKYHLLDAVEMDFPAPEYDVIVWDGAIGHFSPETLDKVLSKIADSLAVDGVFVGSESLGLEGSDHMTRFHELKDFGKLFSKYFSYIELQSQDYRIGNGFLRSEAYWRCSNQPARLKRMAWKTYNEDHNP